MPTHHMNDPARAAMRVSRPPTILLGFALAALGVVDADLGVDAGVGI
jgi:hypothetical protein